jgi:hypothetical protein
MGRLRLVGAALIVAFGFGVFAPVSASAILFLLSEWLANGSLVTSELSSETTGELLLEDSKILFGKASVLCSGSLDGWVGPNSLGWISEMLMLAGVAVSTVVLSGTALECTTQSGCEASTKPKVWASNLGWETEVELMEEGTEAFFVNLILPHVGGGSPGWEIECTVLGTKIVDECTAAEGVAELKLEGATLLEKFSKVFSELAVVKLANCSQGGAESGVIEGGDSIVLRGGGELSVSSEGVEVGEEPTATSLSTVLSGEGKEGETLTVLAGSMVKDKATLSGKNASTATGKVTYNVYADSECKNLVTSAGEVTVSGESVPASSEEELEGGKTYYWQAHYGGDSKDIESTSPCTEVLNVKALVCTLPYCEPTITPGVKVTIPVVGGAKNCTAGPIMVKGTEQFLLTAGHCIKTTSSGTETITQIVQSAYPKNTAEQKEIGKSVTFNSTSSYDIAEVKIEQAGWLLTGGIAPPLLVEWKTPPTVTSVLGGAENKVNERTCFTGAASGSTICGVVLKLGATGAGTANLIETTAMGLEGDSGSPEFAPSTGGVLIQGVFVVAGEEAMRGVGDLVSGSDMITGYPEGRTTCEKIARWKTMWPTVPIAGTGIPAETIVEECKEVGADATIKMSKTATVTGESTVTIGYTQLGWYEPMSQIEAVYTGQTLRVK